MWGSGLRRCSVGLAVVVAFVVAPAAWAAPGLGRWEGAAGSARVVFTVEQTGRGRRYVVRPVVYCSPALSDAWNHGPFYGGPEAWPIESSGAFRAARRRYSPPPFVGRFRRDRGSFVFRVTTCAGGHVHFEASRQPASVNVPSGIWSVALSPRAKDTTLGATTSFNTLGEGDLIDSRWIVYAGSTSCHYYRPALGIPISADGRFSASAPGDRLVSQGRSATISGRFVSPRKAVGTLTVTGPGCAGRPVGFTVTLASATGSPELAVGSGSLRPPAPRRRAARPGSRSLEQVAARLDGANWADRGDNFQRGLVVPTGLSLTDSYKTVYTKATKILRAFQAQGANTVRLPVNLATVLRPIWWPRYRAAIDAAVALGMNVILSYWDSGNSGTIDSPVGRTATRASLGDYPGFEQMWHKVIAAYGRRRRVYFEIMNEPDGYSAGQWDSLAKQWVKWLNHNFPVVPDDRVIVSAAHNRAHKCVGWMQNDLSLLARDRLLAHTLFSVHFYNWCRGRDYAFLFGRLVAPYIEHGVVIDEFGTGVVNKNGASKSFPPYGQAVSDMNVSYMQDLTHDLHDARVGAVYWPGLRAGDSYSVWKLGSDPRWWLDGRSPVLNGNGSIINLLRQAWIHR